MIESHSNSSLGMQFRTCENFGDFADTKSSLNPQNSHKYKSHTANTSIVIRNANQSAKNPSLRGESQDSPKQSKFFRHTERSEVSKSHESNQNNESMIEKRIDETDSHLQHYDLGNLDSRVLDSSLVALAQNDEVVGTKITSDSAEVSLGDFVGFQVRNCEIEHRVHRAVEGVESHESAKETNALNKTKCGFIALIGRPNAGKSTLLNALINENLALTSHKVNATRKQCNIIVTHGNAQMIFIDTPGLHKSQKLLNTLMVDESHKAIESSDIVAFLAPISDEVAHYEAFLDIIKDKKHIVLLTKIDLTSKANLLKKLQSYQKYSDKFEAIIPVSAIKRINLEQILGAICAHLPNSPFLYDSEILTSTHLREIYREKIRESLFNFTNKEVPYTSEVRILRILESENLIKIYAEIITEKTSQKKIIIGQGGKSIKNIGTDARKKIEEFSGCKVFLSLNVVCERGWSKDKKAIEKIMS